MIINRFNSGQGLGNQLWQYAVTRSIADKLKLKFNFDMTNFKGHDFLDLDSGSLPVANPINHFYETLYFDEAFNLISSAFDPRVLQIKKNTALHGHFIDERYFFGNLSQIKKNIKLKCLAYETDNDVCVLNIRGGEYKKYRNFILPKSYWENGINYIKNIKNINKFIVVTDDYCYAKFLFPKFKIISGSIHECYSALYTAKYLILSNSTFSYFPVKSSKVKKFVIAPYKFARFNSSISRWGCASNLYSGWNYLNKDGNLESYKACLKLRDETELYYRDYLNLNIREDYFLKKNRRISEFIPSQLKKPAKIYLGKLFPWYFG
jgi:hypothetical protein